MKLEWRIRAAPAFVLLSIWFWIDSGPRARKTLSQDLRVRGPLSKTTPIVDQHFGNYADETLQKENICSFQPNTILHSTKFDHLRPICVFDSLLVT